jgi:hypothetical protein
MKTKHKAVIALMALGCSAWVITAQNAGNGGAGANDQAPPGNGAAEHPPGPGGPGRHRPPPPIIAALDANHDGVIDEAEIANAPAALRTLDRNGDGKLTMDELLPPPPRGDGPPPRGPRHPDGDGPAGTPPAEK